MEPYFLDNLREFFRRISCSRNKKVRVHKNENAFERLNFSNVEICTDETCAKCQSHQKLRKSGIIKKWNESQISKSGFMADDSFLQQTFIGELTQENLNLLNESLNLQNQSRNESMIQKLKKRKLNVLNQSIEQKENIEPNDQFVTSMTKLNISGDFPKKRKFSFHQKLNQTLLTSNQISLQDMIVLTEYQRQLIIEEIKNCQADGTKTPKQNLIIKVIELLLKFPQDHVLFYSQISYDPCSGKSSLDDEETLFIRKKSYGFSGNSIQNLIRNQAVNCNLMHCYITVIYNELITQGADFHIFPPIFMDKLQNMQTYHFLNLTEDLDKNYLFSSKVLSCNSLFVYILQLDSDFILVTANLASLELVIFNPRQHIFDLPAILYTFTQDFIENFSKMKLDKKWAMVEGNCPKVTHKIDSGVVVAAMVKQIVKRNNLQEFTNGFNKQMVEKITNQMVLELISSKLL